MPKTLAIENKSGQAIGLLRALSQAYWLGFPSAVITKSGVEVTETLTSGSSPFFLAPANLLHKILFCTQFN